MQKVKTPSNNMMEAFKMLPEGTLAELINGSIIMSPSPNASHQRIIVRLSHAFFDYLLTHPIGEIFLAPYDVFLDEQFNAVQPDILFIRKENIRIVEEGGAHGVHGVPDMIIEIISPGNSHHDRVVKRALYERFGVKEYWLIDPETKESVGFILKDEHFEEIGKFSQIIRCVTFQSDFRFVE